MSSSPQLKDRGAAELKILPREGITSFRPQLLGQQSGWRVEAPRAGLARGCRSVSCVVNSPRTYSLLPALKNHGWKRAPSCTFLASKTHHKDQILAAAINVKVIDSSMKNKDHQTGLNAPEGHVQNAHQDSVSGV